MIDIKKDVLSSRGYKYLYQGGHRQFDYLIGKRQPSQSSINNFVQNIRSRKSYCEQRGISYIHILYPSKPIVKKDYLPKELKSEVSS